MIVAVIGSRSKTVYDLEKYLPTETTEIVIGGAIGIDRCAEEYARNAGISLKLFLPDYQRHSKAAPLVRNEEIVRYADIVLAFWDGKSRGTIHVIKLCRKLNKPYHVHMTKKDREEMLGRKK